MKYLKDTKYLTEFGKHLRFVRKSKGFSQEKLANEVGIEISQISRIERGITNTSISTVHRIALSLNIETKELFSF